MSIYSVSEDTGVETLLIKVKRILEKELEEKGGSTITMGIEELLLDRAKNEGISLERAKALEEKKEMIKTFKKLGIAIADISKGTGLSVKEIEAL